MISRAAILISFILLLSCKYDNVPNSDQGAALARMKEHCHLSTEELRWFVELMVKADTAFSFKGPFYAVTTKSGQTIIIHQPLILSCTACRLYDCAGNRIDVATVDQEELFAGMTDSNLIYMPYPGEG